MNRSYRLMPHIGKIVLLLIFFISFAPSMVQATYITPSVLPLPPVTVMLSPTKDTTIYSEDNHASNGGGQYLYVERASAGRRRALMAFNIAGTIPSGATIVSATLQLHASQVAVASVARDISLHTVNTNWGESASNADGLGTVGAMAQSGDTTWSERFYDPAGGIPWITLGGDFNPVASATQAVSGIGTYTWHTPAMASDVQNWLDNPSQNLGWFLKGDIEGVTEAFKRFDSREHLTTGNRPLLTVVYIPPNTPPTANNDSYTLNMNGTLNMPASGVLLNDEDIDGDSLTATLVTGVTAGTLTLNTDGSFSYIPPVDFCGFATFSYRVNDGVIDSNVALVNIHVFCAHSPVAKDDMYTTAEDTLLTVPVSGVLSNDVDADGDPLNATVFTDVSTGTLALNRDGSFTYMPPPSYVGTVTFTYQVDDGLVTSEQKISDLEGGFTGIFDNIDLFGGDSTSIGDLDGDNTVEIAVGVTRDDDGGGNRGAVWILFMNSDGTVKSEQKISDTVGGFGGILHDNDRFGNSIASLGDLDGDNINDIAVSAIDDDDGGGNRGAIWILFLNSDGTVKAEQKISDIEGGFAGILSNSDRFGQGIANIGDLDGDGVTDIAIGTNGDNDGGTDRGAVWILFLNSDGTVKAEQKISDTQGGFTGVLDNGDFFGGSVDSLGDLDGDGVVDLAVGAYDDDDGGGNQGAVWILFMNNDGTVKSEQKISETEGGFTGILDANDRFGIGVSRIDDITGDSIVDLAVGAYHDGDGSYRQGAVWILALDRDGTVKDTYKISSVYGNFMGDLDWEDRFGRSVNSLTDLNGDNIPDLTVGALWDDDGGDDRGAVWVLFLHPPGEDTATVTIDVRPACTAAPAVAVPLTAGISASDVTLNWTHDFANTGGYGIYRGTTPYFDPDTTGTLLGMVSPLVSRYDDIGIAGNPATNYFYITRALNCDGSLAADSNRTGEFDFAMVPGS